MERRVTVNDRIEPLQLEVPAGIEPDEEALADRAATSYGPCLYLGPAGERCSRAAVEGGYCERHHADPALRGGGRSYARVLTATVALLIVVWPYVADLVRDLFRWLSLATLKRG